MTRLDGQYFTAVNPVTLDDGRTIYTNGSTRPTSAGGPTLAPGDKVTATIDWKRRHRLMRMHTLLHLICVTVDADITGCQIGLEKSRIDLNTKGKPDKDVIQAKLDELIAKDLPTAAQWITEKELAAQPELVKTMSVSPPTGIGEVRLIAVEGIDLQPCGGTHVASIGEIGRVRIGKIENKGKQNRQSTCILRIE